MISHSISIAALIVILDRLCDPARDVRPALASSAFTAPQLPLLDDMRTQLIEAQESASALDEQLAQLVVALGADDARSDRSISGLSRSTDGLALLSQDDNPTLAEALAHLHALMTRDGLRALTSARYDSIGGEALMRAAKLTAEHRAALATVNIGGKTLLDYFDGWVALAEELSAKELRRQELLAANKTAPRMTPAQIVQTKRAAINRIERLITCLEDSELDADTKRAILAPIEGAS